MYLDDYTTRFKLDKVIGDRGLKSIGHDGLEPFMILTNTTSKPFNIWIQGIGKKRTFQYMTISVTTPNTQGHRSAHLYQGKASPITNSGGVLMNCAYIQRPSSNAFFSSLKKTFTSAEDRIVAKTCDGHDVDLEIAVYPKNVLKYFAEEKPDGINILKLSTKKDMPVPIGDSEFCRECSASHP